jgi:hypothetical protein
LEKYDLPEAATGQGRTAEKIGKNRTEAEQAAAEAIKQGIKVQESNVFLEGGNVLATGGKVIIGRSSIIVNSELLESRGQLDPQRISQIASSTNWDKDEMDLAIQMAKNTIPSDTPEKEIENTAKIILAKFELTKEFIAKDLNIDPKDIVTVSQPTFHIDMEMRPLSDNKILLNDPKLMNETIDKALRNTPLEKKTLLDMKYNEHELSALNYVLDRTQKELEKAGFEVIRAPGNSGQGRINKNSRIANIMNGTIGQTPSGETLYLTNSSGIPALDKVHGEWLKQNANINQVEFLHHSLLELEGGWDCITVGDLPIDNRPDQHS